METLYDLLGALPNDDAESLRTAFRRAVKGTHPDINPGDPLAALRFRQIVRANEILNDPEQRAAYDHLLDLARIEQASISKQAMARRVYQFASGVLAFAVILIMAVGGYAIYLHLSTAQYRIPRQQLQAAVRQLPQIAATTTQIATAAPVEQKPAAELPRLAVSLEKTTPPEKIEKFVETPAMPEQALAVSATPFPADTGAAMAAFDQAIQLDPKFSAAYIDRGIVFYRLRKFDRAFADISRAKRLERANRAGPPGSASSVVAKKPRPPQAGIALGMMPMFQRRPVGLD